ncbi:MAG: acyltransferase [Micrococcales bacterium]|nr:acyltransferase [Micrococcales bacterium]
MNILKLGGRYLHLDLMRAVAVLLVVIAHAGLGDLVPGGSGVTIFFTISGFVITLLVLQEKKRSSGFAVGWFYIRRALKIVPPLIAIVIVPTLLTGASHDYKWDQVYSQIFFYFNWIYMSGDVHVLPGSGVVWSLSIEEQFYIIFAFIWALLVKKKNSDLYLGAISILFILYANFARLVFAGQENPHNRIYYGSDTRIDAIAIGVLAAIYFLRNKEHFSSKVRNKFSGWDITAFAALGLFALSLIIRDEWFRNTLRYAIQSLSAAVIILYGFTRSENLFAKSVRLISNWSIVKTVGLASYSIYLVHLTISVSIEPFVSSFPLVAQVVVKAILGIGVGIICYLVVEVPALRLKTYLQTKRPKE